MTAADYSSVLLRLTIDLVAIGALNVLVSWRRPRRGLFMVYTAFNVGVFVLLAAIAERHIGPSVGFGLFALLSIVRLRSEPFSNAELTYFFCALVLALVNGLRLSDVPFQILLDAALLLTLLVIDHPSLYQATARRLVTLDVVATDEAALRTRLTEDLGVEVLEVDIEEIDYVRDLTRVRIRHAVPRGGRS